MEKPEQGCQYPTVHMSDQELSKKKTVLTWLPVAQLGDDVGGGSSNQVGSTQIGSNRVATRILNTCIYGRYRTSCEPDVIVLIKGEKNEKTVVKQLRPGSWNARWFPTSPFGLSYTHR